MEQEKKNFIVQDENGIQSVAELLTIIEVNGVEYAVYSIDKDADNSDIYVARVTKDNDENDMIVSIENEEEKAKIFQIVNSMFDKE